MLNAMRLPGFSRARVGCNSSGSQTRSAPARRQAGSQRRLRTMRGRLRTRAATVVLAGALAATACGPQPIPDRRRDRRSLWELP